MLDTLTLQKQLVAAALPSGFERGVGELLSSLAGPYVDEVTRDPLGSVICHKKGPGKKIMLAAHMDVIGFMVSYICDDGTLRFETIGGHTPAFLHRTAVRMPNGARGVIICEKWAQESRKNIGDIRVNSLYIDIGAGSREKAEETVSIGDVAVFDGEPSVQGGALVTPYADNLISCAALLKTMESLKESPYDVYFVFTSQEEVGVRGARTAAYNIHPDIGIAVDVCSTGDTPGTTAYMDVKLGKGATVKIKDASLICNPQVVSMLRKGAERAGVPYQNEILLAGGTDASAIQRSHGGILSGAVSIPTRNVHSPREIVSLSDVEGAASILRATLEG